MRSGFKLDKFFHHPRRKHVINYSSIIFPPTLIFFQAETGLSRTDLKRKRAQAREAVLKNRRVKRCWFISIAFDINLYILFKIKKFFLKDSFFFFQPMTFPVSNEREIASATLGSFEFSINIGIQGTQMESRSFRATWYNLRYFPRFRQEKSLCDGEAASVKRLINTLPRSRWTHRNFVFLSHLLYCLKFIRAY